MCLFVCLSDCMCVCWHVYNYVCLSASVYLYMSIYLCIYMCVSVCFCLDLSVCLCLFLSVYLCLFLCQIKCLSDIFDRVNSFEFTLERTEKLPEQISKLVSIQYIHRHFVNKSYPDSSSSPYLPPRLNSKHHPPCPRLFACLPDSLDLPRCLSILFWTSACE